MRIVSFNTLHVKYEKKYNPNSQILIDYPDDSKRMLKICDIILRNIDINTIMCLQECSNVLVNFLKEKLKDIYTLFADEIEEDVFMVTITSKYMGFQKEEIPDNKYEEIAYGYLVLKNQDLTVINVHLRPQFTVKNKNILTTIKNDVIGKKCIIAGDFNERSKNIINYLSTFMVPYFGITYKEKKGIDHIVYNFPVVNGISKVLDTYSVSDHCAISLILEF